MDVSGTNPPPAIMVRNVRGQSSRYTNLLSAVLCWLGTKLVTSVCDTDVCMQYRCMHTSVCDTDVCKVNIFMPV